MSAKKASFNMLFDENQKQILEYVIDEMYCGAEISKAAFIQWLIKDTACDILQLNDEERQGISDEMLLKIFEHNNEQKQLRYQEIIKRMEQGKNDRV